MIWIKICGITNLEDALSAATLGASALGFIFAPSPRRITPGKAADIIAHVPAAVEKIGVFVDEDAAEVIRVARRCGLTGLQFHGSETPDYCAGFALRVIKAVRVMNAGSLREIERYPSASILLDTYRPRLAGGTGETFPWELAKGVRENKRVILSGGLNPGNVGEAVRFLRPGGVDACSGVEATPGEKDPGKMRGFVERARKAYETAG